MNDSPVDFSISVQGTAPGEMKFVRMLAKDGLKVVAQIDMSPNDFASALLGEEVTAAFSVPGGGA